MIKPLPVGLEHALLMPFIKLTTTLTLFVHFARGETRGLHLRPVSAFNFGLCATTS